MSILRPILTQYCQRRWFFNSLLDPCWLTLVALCGGRPGPMYSTSRTRQNPPVIAEGANVLDLQFARLAHAIQRQVEQRPCRGAKELGRDENLIFIDQPQRRKGTNQTRSGFEQHFVGAALGQCA